MESGIVAEILPAVSGFPFVDGILSTAIALDDADQNQDEEKQGQR